MFGLSGIRVEIFLYKNMRKNVFGRQFKRDLNERTALFKGLISSLVIHEEIRTTEQKAKSVRGLAEKLVTKSRKEKLLAHSLLQPYLTPEALKKMISDIGPRFANRPGGYTRITKLPNRFSDNADMVTLSWVEKKVAPVYADKKVNLSKKEDAAVSAGGEMEPMRVEAAAGKKETVKKAVKKAAPKKKEEKK
jgi:large subunit ribosomal protein L17